MTTAEWSFRQDREAGRENRRSFRYAAFPLCEQASPRGKRHQFQRRCHFVMSAATPPDINTKTDEAFLFAG